MKITRQWAMADAHTFRIKPIRELIERYVCGLALVIDPFANNNRIAHVTNDIDPETEADYHMDALDFLKLFGDSEVDGVLYDPPYSPRQVSECYRRLGKTVDMKTTQSSYWSKQKQEISRIMKPGGIVISCGWNSGGMGKKYGFDLKEILLVPHGGAHNDTIVTVDRKRRDD